MSHKANATDDEVAAMLRAGHTYMRIRRFLGVSNMTIARVRRTLGIPLTRKPISQLPENERAALVEHDYPAAAAMLRNGATYREINAATGITQHTITRIRIALDIPANPKARRPRTFAEIINQHLTPYGSGHAHWDGPHSGALPVLCTDNKRYNARREIFRNHHGREPQGHVKNTCTEPGCLAGPHLGDRITRDTEAEEQRLDAMVTAIFGTDAP